MLSDSIQKKILTTLNGPALSTSMLAKKAKLSRITASKYLSAMESKGIVEVARIGKALAWKRTENKPKVAIIAKTGTARVVQLALGEEFQGVLATSPAQVPEAFLVVTDSIRVARTAEGQVILIGATDENVFCIPELFELGELAALIRKIKQEQESCEITATTGISIEHVEELEDVFGFQGAEELISLTMRLLREHAVPFVQHERTVFLIEGPLPEAVLSDIEQMFHTLLAHLYGEMVTPGEEISYDGVTHTVPCLTITISTPIAVNDFQDANGR